MEIREVTQELVKSSESFNGSKYIPWWDNEAKDGMHRYDIFTDEKIAEINSVVGDTPVDVVMSPIGTYKFTLFHLLVWHNFYDAVKSLIARKADVNATDGKGKGVTPLMLACYRTNLEMVKLLINAGADVMCADSSGKTCWHYIAGARPELAPNFHCGKASAAQRVPIIELLGDNFDAMDADGKTPLVTVIERNDSELSCALVGLLLGKGARTDYKNERGNTLLTLAIKNNHNTAALELAAVKTLVNEPGENGETPLRVAENFNKEAVCMALKDSGATGDCKYNKRMELAELKRITSNAFAFSNGQDNLAPALYLAQKLINTIDEDDDDEVESVADILFNALYSDENCTVLDMIAKAGIGFTVKFSSRGRVWCIRDKCFTQRAGVKAIKKLISLGVDINSAIIGGKTPVHIVAEQPEPHCFGNEKCTYFEDAAALFEPESMTVLDNNGVSAMHVAARFGHAEMLRVMVERGADVNVTQDAPAKSGSTPLHSACERCKAAAAKILISLGADDSIKNADGDTAAHLLVKESAFGMSSDREASRKSRLEILGALKNIDEPRNDGMTPLMLLQYESFIFVGEAQPILLDKGADVNRKDNFGRTALILAASRHCNKDVIKELVRAGADIDAVDENGETALHHALRYGGEDVARYLIKKGADYKRADNKGNTPMTLAAEKGYDTVLELMTDLS